LARPSTFHWPFITFDLKRFLQKRAAGHPYVGKNHMIYDTLLHLISISCLILWKLVPLASYQNAERLDSLAGRRPALFLGRWRAVGDVDAAIESIPVHDGCVRRRQKGSEQIVSRGNIFCWREISGAATCQSVWLFN
jgi:hypothetical protein